MRIRPWIIVVLVVSLRASAGDAPRTSAIALVDTETISEPVQVVDTTSIWANAVHVRVAQVLNGEKFDNAKLAELFRGLNPEAKTLVVGSEVSAESCPDVAVVAYALERAGFKTILIASKGVEAIPPESVKKLTIIAADASKPALKPAAGNRSGALIDTDEVKDDAIDEEDCQMADVRVSERYLGAEKAESVKRAGHIPNSRNVPFTIFFEKTGSAFRFRRADALKKAFELLGYTTDRSPVSYGDNAREAAIGYIAFRLAGYDKARCYEGGMGEWTANPLFQVVRFKWE